MNQSARACFLSLAGGLVYLLAATNVHTSCSGDGCAMVLRLTLGVGAVGLLVQIPLAILLARKIAGGVVPRPFARLSRALNAVALHLGWILTLAGLVVTLV